MERSAVRRRWLGLLVVAAAVPALIGAAMPAVVPMPAAVPHRRSRGAGARPGAGCRPARRVGQLVGALADPADPDRGSGHLAAHLLDDARPDQGAEGRTTASPGHPRSRCRATRGAGHLGEVLGLGAAPLLGHAQRPDPGHRLRVPDRHAPAVPASGARFTTANPAATSADHDRPR